MSAIAQHIITKCGGVDVLAQWCKVSTVTVRRWTYAREKGGTGGIIPQEHIPVIVDKARDCGISIRYSDFFVTPAEDAHD